MSEPMTTAEAVAALEAAGEHVIWIVFTAYNSAAIAVCWRHTEQEALAVIGGLRAAALATGEKPALLWSMPVSDVPRLPS